MDLNSIKLEDKKQEIQIKKRQLELNMLEEQVNRKNVSRVLQDRN